MAIQKMITVYSFNELPEKVKEKVLNRERENIFPNWYEFNLEEWGEKLLEAGFYKTKIGFSGFYSQGDGACFVSEQIDLKKVFLYQYGNLEKYNELNLDKLSEEHDIDTEIVKLVGRYSHNKTVTAIVSIDQSVTDKEAIKIVPEIELALNESKDKLCEEIYESLKEEYEWLTSDEYLINEINEKEILFYSDGREFYEEE